MAHWSDCPETLTEIFDHSEKYVGQDYWTTYLASVAQMDPTQRASELTAWDRRMSEHVTPSRETAEIISRRRELQAIHDLLKSAGR